MRHICLIVPLEDAPLAAALAEHIGGAGYSGLFTTPLYFAAQSIKEGVTGPQLAVGAECARISVGQMDDSFADAWTSAASLVAAAQASNWTGSTLAAISEMCNRFYFDSSADESFAAQSRLGVTQYSSVGA